MLFNIVDHEFKWKERGLERQTDGLHKMISLKDESRCMCMHIGSGVRFVLRVDHL